MYICPKPLPIHNPKTSPSTLTKKKKKLLLSKFIISFSVLVISHELGTIYFDISFYFFTVGR